MRATAVKSEVRSAKMVGEPSYGAPISLRQCCAHLLLLLRCSQTRTQYARADGAALSRCLDNECFAQRPAQVEASDRWSSSDNCRLNGAPDGNDQHCEGREKDGGRGGAVRTPRPP